MKIKGGSMTDIKNTIFSKIIINQDLIKALIIPETNFLDITPTSEEQWILDNPDSLIRKQIFPYQKTNILIEDKKVYITTRFYNFKKKSYAYQSGMVSFYVIVPNSLESSDYGSRYDFIVDCIDEIFSDCGIGKFEFDSRSDMIVDDEHMGAVITFNITDFKLDM